MLSALLLQQTLLFPYIYDGVFTLEVFFSSGSRERVVMDSWGREKKLMVNV